MRTIDRVSMFIGRCILTALLNGFGFGGFMMAAWAAEQADATQPRVIADALFFAIALLALVACCGLALLMADVWGDDIYKRCSCCTAQFSKMSPGSLCGNCRALKRTA